MDTADTSRSLSNLLRFGHIAEVLGPTCRVQSGGLLTDYISCFAPCGGEHNAWCPLSIGEQVLLLCPEGDIANAVALRGLHSAAFPAPSTDPSLHVQVFPDGTQLHYDSEAHTLGVILTAGGNVDITAASGLTLHGPLTVTGAVTLNGDATCAGTVTAEGDVTAAGTSLRNHVHGQVQPGSGQSGAPA